MRELDDSGEAAQDQQGGGVTRRTFLEMGVAATLAAGSERIAWAAEAKGEVPWRTLGRTGEKVSRAELPLRA